jgi:hypothetical protein
VTHACALQLKKEVQEPAAHMRHVTQVHLKDNWAFSSSMAAEAYFIDQAAGSFYSGGRDTPGRTCC